MYAADCPPAAVKLTVPAAEVRGAGTANPPDELRATETFIGQCPLIAVTIEGVELQGLLDTGSQVTLMQQSLWEKHFNQAKLGKTPLVFQLRAANDLEIPYTSYAVLDFEVGVKIPDRGVVIVKDEHCTHPLIGMNVVTACWDALFKKSGQFSLPPSLMKNPGAWRDAFATCQRVDVTMAGDGLLGYVRPAARHNIKVPPESEMMVWGRARMGRRGRLLCPGGGAAKY